MEEGDFMGSGKARLLQKRRRELYKPEVAVRSLTSVLKSLFLWSNPFSLVLPRNVSYRHLSAL